MAVSYLKKMLRASCCVTVRRGPFKVQERGPVPTADRGKIVLQ